MALLEEVVAEMGAEEARSAGDNRCRHNRASVLTGPDRSPSSLRTFFIPARPRSSDVAAAHSGLELPRGSDRSAPHGALRPDSYSFPSESLVWKVDRRPDR